MRRATYDPEVIAEWERQCEVDWRQLRWAWYAIAALAILAPIPLLLGVFALFPYAFVAAFFLCFVAVAVYATYARALECPNCGEHPLVRGRGPMSVRGIDHCGYCYYWLRSPYDRDSRDRDA